MGVELEIAEDADELAPRAAEWLARAIREIPDRTVSLVLSGGSTPQPAHAAFAALEGIPFERIAIFFGDERCVPPDDPESNYRMARESLLDPVGLERFAAVHRMRGEEADGDREAARYAELVPDVFDILMLGIGDDGHTASLFPGDELLCEVHRKVAAVVGPKPPPRRITITPRVVVAARSVLMLVSGHEKAEAVERALEGPADPHGVPAQLACKADPGKPRCWIVDRAAAARLHPSWHASR